MQAKGAKMLLRQLEYFAAVVDEGSFTKAAKRCFVSQSAVSQQVKALEDELGCELLQRAGKRFSVTPAGEVVLAAAHDVCGRVTRMRFDLEHLGEQQRELRVGYLSRYGGWEVQGAVAAFTLGRPQVAVTAVPGSHDDLYEMMLSGAIDMAFNDRRRELSDEFANVHLMTCFTFIEVSGANALAQRDRVNVSQLGETPCILIAQGPRRAAERDYYKNVLNFACPFVFADSMEQARMMVAGNRGFLPIEARAGAAVAQPGGTVIKRIPLANASGQLQRDYYAFWLEARGSWATKEFARILKDLLDSQEQR